MKQVSYSCDGKGCEERTSDGTDFGQYGSWTRVTVARSHNSGDFVERLHYCGKCWVPVAAALGVKERTG